MIGNDVIDLNLARQESNWCRSGFLEKLFTVEERRSIFESDNPEWLVWNLWSRKEAVYKIINRQTGIRAFIPLQIQCPKSEGSAGICFFNAREYHTITYSDYEMIHSIAATTSSDLQNIITVSGRSFISKKEHLPFYKNYPASISHHGKFQRIVALKL